MSFLYRKTPAQECFTASFGFLFCHFEHARKNVSPMRGDEEGTKAKLVEESGATESTHALQAAESEDS